ncbi:hypothetical protein KFK09_004805 [Dendrobium nobile]|uniref:Uncharacterized protein n=1 Tax=Dendrobium nobile TaxID=94219 RepID=A0A8T3BZI7_DENNO|nr:hypothetical protein KFK09_004805 [Dendrobium nobile]
MRQLSGRIRCFSNTFPILLLLLNLAAYKLVSKIWPFLNQEEALDFWKKKTERAVPGVLQTGSIGRRVRFTKIRGGSLRNNGGAVCPKYEGERDVGAGLNWSRCSLGLAQISFDFNFKV